MRTIALCIEYEGTEFSGYQRQKGLATVQGLLEEMLSDLFGHAVTAVCAGRTDAGVHAIGQVVHVRTHSDRPLEVVARALARKAHGRLGVRGAWEAPTWFHARHNASRRIYQYHILCQDSPAPNLRHRAWHMPRPLDLQLMRGEAYHLIGRRDFRAFHSGGSDELRHFFRTLYRFDIGLAACASRSWLHRVPLLVCEIEADAFLPHMVRMMVGTLVAVASGLRPAGSTARVLRSRDPKQSSAASPAHGLCLVRVTYPPGCRVGEFAATAQKC